MGASSDLFRPENNTKRLMAIQIRDVLLSHERDWNTGHVPIQSYPGAAGQAKVVQKMIQESMHPDTCNGCGNVQK
jgi:hypothetical protein